jgi:hypothetical protein
VCSGGSAHVERAFAAAVSHTYNSTHTSGLLSRGSHFLPILDVFVYMRVEGRLLIRGSDTTDHQENFDISEEMACNTFDM